MPYGGMIKVAARRPAMPGGMDPWRNAHPGRERAPVFVGILVGSPISLLMWGVLIFGLRGFF